MTALTIRGDRTPAMLRKLAKAEANTRVARRLLAIANALSGMSRKEAAEAAGMDRQTLRDWVIRYNTYGLDGLYDCWGDGRPARLEPDEQAELIRIVLEGPAPESGLSAFTREDLVRHLRSPLWQDLPSGLAGAAVKAPWLLAAEGKAQPPAKRPGPGRGL